MGVQRVVLRQFRYQISLNNIKGFLEYDRIRVILRFVKVVGLWKPRLSALYVQKLPYQYSSYVLCTTKIHVIDSVKRLCRMYKHLLYL
jgi:hypothetical protein